MGVRAPFARWSRRLCLGATAASVATVLPWISGCGEATRRDDASLRCDASFLPLAGSHRLEIVPAGNHGPRFAEALQDHYAPYGLSFERGVVEPVEPPSFLIDNDPDSLENALRAAFPHLDLHAKPFPGTDAELAALVRFSANHVLGPLIEFVGSSLARERTTWLMSLPTLTSDPDEPGWHVAGLTISPALLRALRSEADPEAEVWRAVELPERFTPLVAIDEELVASLQALDPDGERVVTAHEFAHTAGLTHHDGADNLMRGDVAAGRLGERRLAEWQVEHMAAELGLGCAAGASKGVDSVDQFPKQHGASEITEGLTMDRGGQHGSMERSRISDALLERIRHQLVSPHRTLLHD